MTMRGDESEEKACSFLKQEGYQVVARNWRTRVGELDIIARDGDVLVFVEVKARSRDDFGGPEAAVDRTKQRRLIAAARSFLAATHCELATRFDVVAIRPGSMRLYQDAFQVDD
jgi:putative endonuclease